ncbi:MAG: transcription antitermination factor NusB [Coriobacteriia bacterium]|nr:transcription antitermination factor NusB [Coriobacteriia bacterium]
MLERSKARRQALHILYQREVTGERTARILSERSYSTEEGEPVEYARALTLGVEAHLADLDDRLETISENWSVARMPLVDRNILRLAAYEILFGEDVPPSVAINEAVELAKVFGGNDSSKFVNGVLGRLAETFATESRGEGTEEGG